MTAKAGATSLGIDQEKSTASTTASASGLIPFPSSDLRSLSPTHRQTSRASSTLVKTLREALEPFGSDYADRFVGPEEV